MNIRRYYYPGQIVFITQIIKDRRPVFINQEKLDLLREVIKNVKALYPFTMLAYVFLPNHFHILIQPSDQVTFSQIMHSLKTNFTRAYKQKAKRADGLNFWQKRFWDHVIRDERDLEDHIHYIHYNPIKHGYVDDMSKWEYSSFREWQKRGLYDDRPEWIEPENMAWGE